MRLRGTCLLLPQRDGTAAAHPPEHYARREAAGPVSPAAGAGCRDGEPRRRGEDGKRQPRWTRPRPRRSERPAGALGRPQEQARRDVGEEGERQLQREARDERRGEHGLPGERAQVERALEELLEHEGERRQQRERPGGQRARRAPARGVDGGEEQRDRRDRARDAEHERQVAQVAVAGRRRARGGGRAPPDRPSGRRGRARPATRRAGRGARRARRGRASSRGLCQRSAAEQAAEHALARLPVGLLLGGSGSAGGG